MTCCLAKLKIGRSIIGLVFFDLGTKGLGGLTNVTICALLTLDVVNASTLLYFL